jgi:Protein of unknown function (DUF3375)
MIDFDTLHTMRERHPAWRLLRYENAPLVVAFLHRTFVLPNQRVIAQSDLVEALEDDSSHFANATPSWPATDPRLTT